MDTRLERTAPMDIERRSFEIIESELPHAINEKYAPIIKRVIHTTADFEYVDTLCFSSGVVEKAHEAIRRGITIVTDTTMAMSGINKRVLAGYGGSVKCFIADEDVAEAARRNGTTQIGRAHV